MIATYQGRTIEAIKKGDGWHTTIDGHESGNVPAKYKRVAIRRAIQACQEQEQNRLKALQLKELGL